MRADIKYLSIGLFIGLGITALLLTGMLVPPTLAASLSANTSTSTTIISSVSPLPSPTNPPPTSTFTPTPTYILLKPPTSTNTPTVTPTVPTPTPTFSETLAGLLDSGYISQVGPLSLKQQFQVYNAAINYVRQTSEESRAIGEAINGEGYGSPTDICGPLSIAILQDAEFVNTELDPHTYWLLNPDVPYDRRLLTKAFPTEHFESIRIEKQLNKVDWVETPLYPGDFIYIYAGSGGNFEHMLVVSRVDSQGRAYAVTNHSTEEGFVISEVLLYHPEKSNVGMFPVWTEYRNKESGATGFGGLEIWRKR